MVENVKQETREMFLGEKASHSQLSENAQDVSQSTERPSVLGIYQENGRLKEKYYLWLTAHQKNWSA